MADESFYLYMLSMREAADSALHQCYSQLCSKMGYYNGTVTVTVDGESQPLSDAHMDPKPDPDIPPAGDGFVIFRGVYIKAFEDGGLLVQLIKDISAELGRNQEELDAKIESFSGKNNANLRAVYWYIEKNFVSSLTPKHQVCFNVDCLMFGGWQCSHRNVIGMHMVALACMMEVKQLVSLLPPEVTKNPIVSNPTFKGFLQKKAITMSFLVKDVKKAGAGAGVAKTVEKVVGGKEVKKGVKDDKKGVKDDKKGVKDDKKSANNDKKSANNDKKGVKDDKKSANNDKKGVKDDKKIAKKEAKKDGKK